VRLQFRRNLRQLSRRPYSGFGEREDDLNSTDTNRAYLYSLAACVTPRAALWAAATVGHNSGRDIF